MRGWLGSFGSVVNVILWITVAVFLVQLACAALRMPFFDQWFALSGTQVRRGCFWQPFTYMFLHDTGNLFHILINLFVLWMFGREVEYFIGPKYFTRLYLLGGLAGAALWLAFNWYSPVPVLGASAAVLACVIAYATLFPDREITLLVFFVLPVTLKAKYMALVAVALDVVPLLTGTGTSVAHLAHLGGAAFGYIYIKQLGYGTTPRWLLALQRAGRSLRPRRPRDARAAYDNPEDFIRKEVDPILDKIAREGIQSLTRRERKILESARDLMQK
jgi:membrane associated rhomboid family serine protease